MEIRLLNTLEKVSFFIWCTHVLISLRQMPEGAACGQVVYRGDEGLAF